MNNDTTRFWIVFILVLTFLSSLVLGFTYYRLITAQFFIAICVIGVSLAVAFAVKNS